MSESAVNGESQGTGLNEFIKVLVPLSICVLLLDFVNVT